MSEMNAEKKLDALWRRGCSFLGSRTAILGGAMSWVSDRNLVSAISNAGGFGVIACGAMTPELLASEIAETQAKTKKPFGVNLITMHPELEALINVCAEASVTHVVLAGGVPSSESIVKLKKTGIKIICFAPALALAKRMIKNGADALIIEGTEAGGHIGPVATSVLAQEILPHITDIPVFVAGGISRGEAIVSYLEMGASGCQLGTRFVCANESIAHPNFKETFIRANSRDAVPTVQIDPKFPIIPVRALVNEGTKLFSQAQREAAVRVEKGEVELKEAQLEIEHFWAGALKRAVIDGDVEYGSLMAGQSVGMVKTEQPTQEIIDELIHQAIHCLSNRGKS